MYKDLGYGHRTVYIIFMKYGTQASIARIANISRQQINDYLAGRKNASAPVAKKISALTASDPFIWMKGGDVAARRVAVEKVQVV